MGFFDLMQKKLNGSDLPVPAKKAEVSVPVQQIPATLDAVNAAERSEARERRRFLELVDLTKKGIGAKAAAVLVAANHADEFPILTASGNGGKSQLTYDNYRNWRGTLLKARKEQGDLTDEQEICCLVKRYQHGEKGSRCDGRFLELFRQFYLNRNCLTIPQAYRMACDAWIKVSAGVPAGTLGQCRLELRRIAPEVIVRAREGETAWKNRCCDYISRNWNDLLPGDVAIGDSRTFDTRVRVWTGEKWESRRPTIAALLDARSWKFTAYWITTEPVNADTLINTLALWCRNTGGVPPSVCYFDNGKDYNAAGFSTPLEVKGGYRHSIFAELGIKLINATAYNGRAKTVERAFRDMMLGFDKLFLDYLGSNPAKRSDASSYYDQHPDELPSLEAFCKVFAGWLDKYHATPKQGKIHGGKSPDEIWQSRPADTSRRMTPESLMLAFLRPEGLRLVGRGGQIQLGNEFYVTSDVRWGETVLVKRSCFDHSFLGLYTADGRRLGIARSREAIRAIAEGKDERARLAELIARQKEQDKAARTMLHDLTGGVYGASPLEILLTAGLDADFRETGSMHLVKGGTHLFRKIEAGGMARLEENNAEDGRRKAEKNNAEGGMQNAECVEDSAEFTQNPLPHTATEERGEDHVSEEEMTEVYNFISNKNHRGEEDDD